MTGKRAAVDVNKCLKKTKLPVSNPMYATLSKLPSYLRTMSGIANSGSVISTACIDNSLQRYAPWDVVQLYSTKHNV